MTTQLRDYQEAAVEFLSKHRRALVVSAAGSGKTWMLAAALARVIQARPRASPPKVLWAANTRDQVSQATAALGTFCKHIAEYEVLCMAGLSPDRLRDISPDVLVVDEAHHLATAESWQRVADAHGDKALWCCTATPWGRDPEANARLKAYCRGNIHTVSRESTARSVAPTKYCMVEFEAKPGLRQAIEEATLKDASRYQHMSDELMGKIRYRWIVELGITTHEHRSEALWKQVIHHEEPRLVLVPTIKLGRAFEGRCNGALVTSKTRARADIIKQFTRGRIDVLIATSLADEGLDVPVATVLVNMAGGRNENRTEQRAGRVMRTHAGKGQAYIYDALDTWHPLAAKHSSIRASAYHRICK